MRNLVERATAVTVLATALVASGAGHARASLMTYTETATVSGSLGSTTFTDATITFTQTADPANGVVIAPVLHELNVLDITATLMITGGDLTSPLAATITESTYTFVGTAGLRSGNVGFGHLALPVGNAPLIAAIAAAPPTYDLTTSLGPVSGPSFIQAPGHTWATTAGDLILDEAGTVTFQAVPEPSSLALAAVACATGLAIAAGRRPRRVGR